MIRSWMQDLPGARDWVIVRPAEPDGTGDELFEIYTKTGTHLCLRTADAGRAHEEYAAFTRLQRFQGLGFPLPAALSCGLQGGRFYQLTGWVEGEPLDRLLHGLPEAEQYRLGTEAGRVLAALHSVPLDTADRTAGLSRAGHQLSMLNRYARSAVRMAGDDTLLSFLRPRLGETRRLAYCHGSFAPAALVLTPDGRLGVTGFGLSCAGDRWEDFHPLGLTVSDDFPAFACGQLHGYFGGDPPAAFWQALSLYTALHALTGLVRAQPFGEQAVHAARLRYARAGRDFRGFTPCEPPRWYEPVSKTWG